MANFVLIVSSSFPIGTPTAFCSSKVELAVEVLCAALPMLAFRPNNTLRILVSLLPLEFCPTSCLGDKVRLSGNIFSSSKGMLSLQPSIFTPLSSSSISTSLIEDASISIAEDSLVPIVASSMISNKLKSTLEETRLKYRALARPSSKHFSWPSSPLDISLLLKPRGTLLSLFFSFVQFFDFCAGGLASVSSTSRLFFLADLRQSSPYFVLSDSIFEGLRTYRSGSRVSLSATPPSTLCMRDRSPISRLRCSLSLRAVSSSLSLFAAHSSSTKTWNAGVGDGSLAAMRAAKLLPTPLWCSSPLSSAPSLLPRPPLSFQRSVRAVFSFRRSDSFSIRRPPPIWPQSTD
mmetsp:Transcript_8026/g.23876  ORF Transcript_8026/g.23876 Transcript_8026/m.23876 type:complete len:347 (+) Transcript_8026:2319-3359(+)